MRHRPPRGRGGHQATRFCRRGRQQAPRAGQRPPPRELAPKKPAPAPTSPGSSKQRPLTRRQPPLLPRASDRRDRAPPTGRGERRAPALPRASSRRRGRHRGVKVPPAEHPHQRRRQKWRPRQGEGSAARTSHAARRKSGEEAACLKLILWQRADRGHPRRMLGRYGRHSRCFEIAAADWNGELFHPLRQPLGGQVGRRGLGAGRPRHALGRG